MDAVAVQSADFQGTDWPSVQDEAQRLEDLSPRMRCNGNLELQPGRRGDFHFDLGAHFSSHSAMMRQSFRIRQPGRPPRPRAALASCVVAHAVVEIQKQLIELKPQLQQAG
jgi:hypothetical protein